MARRAVGPRSRRRTARPRTRAAVAAALVFVAGACRSSLPITRSPLGAAIEIACCSVPGAPIELTYLGVGGWLVRRGSDSVLAAPLFSNPSLLRAGLSAIAPDTLRIDQGLEALGVDLAGVSLVLSGHGHYDHLMDVPRIMGRHARGALLLANRTSAHQIAPWGLGERVLVVNDSAGDVEGAGRWIRRGGVRVMPLRSHHGPHLAGITLFRGHRTRDLEEPPPTALDWLDGDTFAYLVDFMDGEEVAFRLYYQDAVASAPFGFVPAGLVARAAGDGHPVDLAILVPSTYAEVAWHPEAILDNVRPRHVLLGHWEDFFGSPGEPPRPVPGTRLGGFLERLERALPEGVGWHLPAPGTRFRVP